ncbi:serine/threonine-protein kinase [Streptomyces muensis]|uniref:non-specific serine/threonine protein kinase n=1 Tax=Streptomyces muensis TaxID=1077944 RepID=A0A9X1PRN4_STRM4|nr:serine/threonine-protein kinase [Streptomyces muensis]MCF1592267.1 protein kinase [Streptomyces muensis]
MSEADRGAGRRVVDGRFELEARLGGGGMGTVWRARDLALHRLVAVKEVRPPDRDLAEYDPDGARMLRERVLREARALARIDHPNVVTVHHIVDGGEGTYPWIVMELVTGGSLADRLARGPMPPHEAAGLGRGVLAALTAAHDAGIQHRDVKPANVLLRPDGRPVLTDFGIAAIREATSLTATGSIIGTADFMAPERVSGHEGGSASDLWSLAMMLYAAVEGHHPLRRGTTLATLAAVLHDDVPPPVQAGPLGDVLMSVLVRDASARPSAAVLDTRLAEVESGTAGPAVREEPTSYPLHPPSALTASGSAPVPSRPGQHPAQPVTAPARAERRRIPGRAAALSLSGTSLAGALVLLWWLVPFGGGTGDKDAGGPSSSTTSAPDTTLGPKPTLSPTGAAPAAQKSKEPASGSLLTPDGIRTAVKALTEDTGRDMFGDFTVYPDYVSARLMVDGSDSAYDSYTYRPGEGVKKGIINGTLMGGDQPVSLDHFNWDRVPALFEEAEKKLNVKDPELRYMMVRQPDDIFDTPAGMAFYLTDSHGRAGYLEADTDGKVTRVMPAED